MKKLIRRFYQVLEEDKGDYIRVKDAEMSIRLIDAILESGRSGAYVTHIVISERRYRMNKGLIGIQMSTIKDKIAELGPMGH